MTFELQDTSITASAELLNEINMTPLVDVMLVLLIVFIITLPVMQHAIKINVPVTTAHPQQAKPETLLLSLDAQGQLFVNQRLVNETQLLQVLHEGAVKTPQPNLHVRADKAVRYELVAQAMALVQQSGLRQISLVTEPKN
jgi:biopolymer transport protein ExbD